MLRASLPCWSVTYGVLTFEQVCELRNGDFNHEDLPFAIDLASTL
jgi:hypothetical protein